MTWQPIETAPKPYSGEPILLYRPTWKGCVNSDGIDIAYIAYWDVERGAFKPRPFWHSLLNYARKSDMRNHPPTHWQPLPAPPDTAGEGK